MTDTDAISRGVSSQRIAFWAAVIGSIGVLSLHARFVVGAGPLWRDEIASVEIAHLDAWGDVIRNLKYDSFPIGWQVVLRSFVALVSPSSLDYRLFGAIIGVGLLVATWLTGMAMNRRPPVLAIFLLLANGAVVRWGDSVRAYGLGMIAAVVTYWSVWRFVHRRDLHSFALATALAIASVQLTYHSPFVILGTCVAAALTAFLRNDIRTSLLSLLVGAIAASTLVPYVNFFHQAADDWIEYFRFATDLSWIHAMWAWSIRYSSGIAALACWYGAVTAAGALAVVAFLHWRRALDNDALFHATALLVAVPLHLVFLLKLGYPTAPWYYLFPMTFVTITLEGLLSSLKSETIHRATQSILVLVLSISFTHTWRYVGQRMTNADLVARAAERVAGPSDLILVPPWWLGIAWGYYYDGAAPWSADPPVSLSSWALVGFDFTPLSDPSAGDDLWRKVAATYRAGHRVFVVIVIPWPNPAHEFPRPRKAPVPSRLAGSKGYKLKPLYSPAAAPAYERLALMELLSSAPNPGGSAAND